MSAATALFCSPSRPARQQGDLFFDSTLCTANATAVWIQQELHLAAVLARGNGSDAHTTVRPGQDHVSGKNRAEEEESRYEIATQCPPESSDETVDGRHFEGMTYASCLREVGSAIYRGPATTKGSSKS